MKCFEIADRLLVSEQRKLDPRGACVDLVVVAFDHAGPRGVARLRAPLVVPVDARWPRTNVKVSSDS